jgi:hypothetical protein
MLNYGIRQNDQVSLSDIDGEEFTIDLSLYEELGNEAYKVGDEIQALKWYNRGLKLANEMGQQEKIRLFSNLIFVSL